MSIKLSYINLLGNKKGFTLLEILIAIFILVTILSTVYASYRITLQIINDSKRDRDAYTMARNTMARIMKDLESVAAADGKYLFLSQPSSVQKMGFSDLTFLSRSHLAFSEKDIPSGLAEITYYLEEEETGGSYRLMRRDVLYAKEKLDSSNENGFVICEGLLALTYKFFDAGGMEYDSWDAADTGGSKSKVPAMVSIKLELKNRQDVNRPYIFVTKVFLPSSTIVPPPSI